MFKRFDLKSFKPIGYKNRVNISSRNEDIIDVQKSIH